MVPRTMRTVLNTYRGARLAGTLKIRHQRFYLAPLLRSFPRTQICHVPRIAAVIALPLVPCAGERRATSIYAQAGVRSLALLPSARGVSISIRLSRRVARLSGLQYRLQSGA